MEGAGQEASHAHTATEHSIFLSNKMLCERYNQTSLLKQEKIAIGCYANFLRLFPGGVPASRIAAYNQPYVNRFVRRARLTYLLFSGEVGRC
jgi:hypothetical protein